MEGAFPLAIYVAIGITGAAFGQTEGDDPNRELRHHRPLAEVGAAERYRRIRPLGAAGPIVAPPPRPVERW